MLCLIRWWRQCSGGITILYMRYVDFTGRAGTATLFSFFYIYRDRYIFLIWSWVHYCRWIDALFSFHDVITQPQGDKSMKCRGLVHRGCSWKSDTGGRIETLIYASWNSNIMSGYKYVKFKLQYSCLKDSAVNLASKTGYRLINIWLIDTSAAYCEFKPTWIILNNCDYTREMIQNDPLLTFFTI